MAHSSNLQKMSIAKCQGIGQTWLGPEFSHNPHFLDQSEAATSVWPISMLRDQLKKSLTLRSSVSSSSLIHWQRKEKLFVWAQDSPDSTHWVHLGKYGKRHVRLMQFMSSVNHSKTPVTRSFYCLSISVLTMFGCRDLEPIRHRFLPSLYLTHPNIMQINTWALYWNSCPAYRQHHHTCL